MRGRKWIIAMIAWIGLATLMMGAGGSFNCNFGGNPGCRVFC